MKMEGRGPFDIFELIKACSIDMVCGKICWNCAVNVFKVHRNIFIETTLGVKMEVQKDKNSEMLKSAHFVLKTCGKRFFLPWLQPEILFYLSKFYVPHHKAIDYLERTVSKVKLKLMCPEQILIKTDHF